jgi:ribosomal protein S12 methylthiotransferase accessory factor YcaO
MTTSLDPEFNSLLNDEVLVEGLLASDTRSLWRRLARTAAVQQVATLIAGDPRRIAALSSFVQQLLEEPCDAKFRHPHEMAICATLVILEQSPLPSARTVFARLKAQRKPSLALVRALAEYCDSRFVDSSVASFTLFERIDVPEPQAFWIQSDPSVGNSLIASNLVELQLVAA